MTRDEITSELGALMREVADTIWLHGGNAKSDLICTRATLRMAGKKLAQIQVGVDDAIAARSSPAVPDSVKEARNHVASVCVDRILERMGLSSSGSASKDAAGGMDAQGPVLVKGYGVSGEDER